MQNNDVTMVDNGQESAPEQTIAKNKINPKIAAIVAGGLVSVAMLTGTVAYANSENNDTNQLNMDTQGGASELFGLNAGANNNENTGQQQGTPFNIHTAPHAHNVNDNMSFDQAFAAARQETGAGGIFVWKGQLYGTFQANEVDTNGHPTIQYSKVEASNATSQQVAENNIFEQSDSLDEIYEADPETHGKAEFANIETPAEESKDFEVPIQNDDSSANFYQSQNDFDNISFDDVDVY